MAFSPAFGPVVPIVRKVRNLLPNPGAGIEASGLDSGIGSMGYAPLLTKCDPFAKAP